MVAEFYDPFLYDLNIGPGSRVGSLYLAEVKRGSGPVLELGCGTGDVLLPIAAAGFEVVGLDASKAMLDKCRERVLAIRPSPSSSIQLVEGKMERFSLDRKFNQIIIANDGIAHLLDEKSLRDTASNCFAHLLPGGRLIMDISFFDVQYLGSFVGSARENLRDRGCFPLEDGGNVQVWEQTQYDQNSGVLTAKFRYEFLDKAQNVINTYYRQLFLCPRRPAEVAFLLEAVGFENIHIRRLDGETLGWLFQAERKLSTA